MYVPNNRLVLSRSAAVYIGLKILSEFTRASFHISLSLSLSLSLSYVLVLFATTNSLTPTKARIRAGPPILLIYITD